ncbi:hypothetical protein GIB67_026979 [Kingdonia uniflora]|uniref:Uncharacterized protein n=1 Tax=Kingdonia uniflora TaxID=39325 RepID=A0A7J7P278_9MAGN|nr:hypothetical protein GIB67_026979 [Kingdonia uniflora]
MKPSSKMVVSSSDDSSSSGRTIDDAEVRGTVTVDMPAVVQSGVNERLEGEVEAEDFFKYPADADVGKTFSKYKKDLARDWGHYVMNAGLSFRTLVRPDGRIEHYQVPSLDQWKRNMDIRDDVEISYYNGTGVEVVEKGFICYLNQVVYGLSIPLIFFFQKGVMNALECCPAQLNGNVFEMMRVCEALNKKWKGGDSARQFIADDVLKYYKLKYMKVRKNGYLYSDSVRPKFFDFKYVGRPWCDHLVMVRGVADTSSLFDVVSREGTDLNQVLEELEIPACAAGTSSSLVRRPRVKKMVPPSEQTAPVQIQRGVDLKVVEQEALDLAKRDPIRLDTQIRSSISRLSVAWKSAAEVLKVAAADRAKYEAEKASLAEQLKERTALYEQLQKEKVLQKEQFEKEEALQKDQFEKEAAAIKKEVEDEAKKAVDIVVASRNKLIQAFYFWGLSIEDIDLALAGKYNKIIFPGDDASPVAEQSPTPPVADDTTKEEVVRLRGKVTELEKALCRARDSINHRKIHAQLEIDLRHACDELERCKGHNACLERENVECTKLLQSSEKRVTLLEAHLLDTQKRLQVSQSRLKKKITPKRGKRAINTNHERQIADVIAFYGGKLERVENEFRRYILSYSKDVEVENDKVENMWFAKENEGRGASTSKPRAEESEEEEVEDLLPHTRHMTRP